MENRKDIPCCPAPAERMTSEKNVFTKLVDKHYSPLVIRNLHIGVSQSM